MQTKAKAEPSLRGSLTSMRPHFLQRKCASCGQHTFAGGGCSDCDKKKGLLQRRASSNKTAGDVPPIVHEVLRSPGEPLDAATRAFMEPRFGHDFSQVRVHTNAKAGESADAVNALAYTVGRDVVFGAGQYVPRTHEGSRLIAHELAHTVQQSSANARHRDSLTVSRADDAAEQDAERAASQIDGATHTHKLSLRQPQLQREPKTPRPDQSAPATTQTKAGKAPTQPLCPSVGTGDSHEELRQAVCAAKPPAGTPLNCAFRPEQQKGVDVAKAKAVENVRRADHIIKDCRGGRDFAAELAKKLLMGDEVPIETVVGVLDRVGKFLSGNKVTFQGRTCADDICRSGATVAYVTAPGTLPIYICPGALRDPKILSDTILHESLHWSGIVSKFGEAYCPPGADCDTSCGTSDLADAWKHYLICIGEAMPRIPRCDFRKKILESVEDID